MKNINIFQIFYSEKTKKELDPGFLPLDYIGNERPDWREYWPIREYILSNHLDEEGLYGFFSPKFNEKTSLSAIDCYEFIKCIAEDADVYSFSPFFDLAVWYQNSFDQAIYKHPNAGTVIKESLAILAPFVSLEKLVMHSGNNIFCNYFVAKPKFWRVWFNHCEKIFNEAGLGVSALAAGLNSPADCHHSNAPIKNFIIERIASLILATDKSWNVKVYDPFKLPLAPTLISKEVFGLLELDALKIAYTQSGRDEYLNLFRTLREVLSKKINS